LSIPSPDPAWQVPVSIPIGQWLHWLIPALPADQVIAIHTYALCILAGIVAAVWLTNRRLVARGAEPGIVFDVILWAVPLGLVGARLYHVFTHPGDYFYEGADPWKILAIWEGGNAIFGSLIGGAVGAWIGCRLTGLRFWTFADALAPAMLLAQAFGRLGNYFNHELYGLPTDLPWGLEIEKSNPAFPVGLPEGTLFHPTFLYEIIWNLAGMAILLLLDRKFRLQWGKLWALYLVWYGIGRAVFESIRIDPSEIYYGIRTNVWAALFAIVVGIALFAIQSRRHAGDEPSPYVPGREWRPASAVIESEATYSDSDDPGDGAESEGVAKSPDEHATSVTGTKSS